MTGFFEPLISELNAIWSKSLKKLSSIEELLQEALGATKPKFLTLHGEVIHLSVAKFKDEEIISGRGEVKKTSIETYIWTKICYFRVSFDPLFVQ